MTAPSLTLDRAPRPLSIVRREDADGVTLALVGELDIASAPDLNVELERAETSSAGCITLDLSELTFVDSTGLHAIYGAHRRAVANGHRFVVANPSGAARRLLRMTGLDSQFVIA